MTIRSATFEKSADFGNPRKLALTLYHERVHYDELVSTGWLSDEEAELRAWAAELKTAQALGITKKDAPDEYDIIKGGFDKYRKAVLDAKGDRSKLSPAFPSAKDEKEDKKDFLQWQEELSKIRDGQERLKTQVVLRQNVKEAREMVLDACADVGYPGQEDLDALGRLGSAAYGSVPIAAIPPGYASCGERVFERMLGRLRAGQQLDAAWLREETGRIRREKMDHDLERLKEDIRYLAELDRQYKAGRDYLGRLAARECVVPGRMTGEEARDIRAYYRLFEEYQKRVDERVVLVNAVPEGLTGCPKDLVVIWLVWQMTGQAVTPESCNAASREMAGKYPAQPSPGGDSQPGPSGDSSERDHGRIRVPTLDEVLDRLRKGG